MQEINRALNVFKNGMMAIYPDLSEAEWAYIARHCEVTTIAARRLVIEENKTQRNIFFLVSGLVRGYYNNAKGEEITVRFINHTGWVTHYTALISNRPSGYIFQTLEESELITLPYTAITEGYDRFKGLERFGRLIAESVLRTQQQRIEGFQFLSAEQRYLAFVESFPELFNRVSLSYLSTYLGIKRQSLTRIRSKLAMRSQ